MKKWLYVLAMLMSLTILTAQNSDFKKDTYIFIDISGSSYSYFKEMQNYAIDNILSEINKETKLSIYKFYGKCVNIYDQTVRTDYDLKFAKDRISKLLPNGPWTNLDLVKSVIEENNIDLKTANVYILTDGHQELESGEKEFFLSEENIEEFLDGCELISKNNWFLLIYKDKEKIEATPIIETPKQIENSEKSKQIEIPVEKEVKRKKTFDINLAFLKMIIWILALVSFLLILLEIITFAIWKKEKQKSEKLKQFWKHFKLCLRDFIISIPCFVVIASIAIIISFFYINIFLIGLLIITLIAFLAVAIFSIKNSKRNISYSMQINRLYKRLTKNNYIDLVEAFGQKASECNEVLYLKRKKIEDLEVDAEEDDEKLQEKQLIFGLALKKINDTNAIGIQRFSNFYFINLEAIFKELNLKFTDEERKEIANFIAKSYGNDKLDKFDWAMGASIGLITGLMDVFLVGKPGDSKLQKIVDGHEEKIVKLAAKICGYKGKSTERAVNFLEKKFWVPYDKTKNNEIGMTEDNHHLISLAHSNDIIGLLFSILDTKLSIDKSKEKGGVLYTVVTCTYPKDQEIIEKIKQNSNLEFVWGGAFVRLVEPLTFQSGDKKDEEKTIDNLGKNVFYKFIYEKCKNADETTTVVLCIILGFVLWLGHLYSDKIGASSTVKKGNRGSGIAAPFQELFANTNINFRNQILEKGKERIQKELDKIGKEMFEKGFDNRFFKVQKIPVFINEYLTKITYICKEIFYYDKDLDIKDIIQILLAEGTIKTTTRAISGTSNFELEKTLLISFSTFSIVDVADAAGKSITPAGFVPNIDTFLSINYAGLAKLGKESVSVLLSYIRRWSANPKKIVKEIEEIAKKIDTEDESDKIENGDKPKQLE